MRSRHGSEVWLLVHRTKSCEELSHPADLSNAPSRLLNFVAQFLEAICPQHLTKHFRRGQLRRRRPTFEVEGVFIEGRCDLKSVVDETEDEGVELMAYWSESKELFCWKSTQDCEENLRIVRSL